MKNNNNISILFQIETMCVLSYYSDTAHFKRFNFSEISEVIHSSDK